MPGLIDLRGGHHEGLLSALKECARIPLPGIQEGCGDNSNIQFTPSMFSCVQVEPRFFHPDVSMIAVRALDFLVSLLCENSDQDLIAAAKDLRGKINQYASWQECQDGKKGFFLRKVFDCFQASSRSLESSLARHFGRSLRDKEPSKAAEELKRFTAYAKGEAFVYKYDEVFARFYNDCLSIFGVDLDTKEFQKEFVIICNQVAMNLFKMEYLLFEFEQQYNTLCSLYSLYSDKRAVCDKLSYGGEQDYIFDLKCSWGEQTNLAAKWNNSIAIRVQVTKTRFESLENGTGPIFNEVKLVKAPGLFDFMVEKGIFRSQKQVRQLNVSGSQIKQFPAKVFDSLTELQVLDISDNPLTSFDPAILDHARAMKKLIVSESQRSLIEPHEATLKAKHSHLTIEYV